MGTTQRISLIVLAVAVAVVAYVVFKPDDKEPATRPAGQSGQSPARATPERKAAPPQKPTAQPQPEVHTVRIEAGEPVGGVQRIEARSGDIVRIAVRSDVDDEAHLHGFDLSEAVGPGRTATFRFKADIEGVFELELEQRGVEIGQLEVRP